jgi:hypothetical protein
MLSGESVKGGMSSREIGHGGVGYVTVFGKKLREQQPWKVEKICLSLVF